MRGMMMRRLTGTIAVDARDDQWWPETFVSLEHELSLQSILSADQRPSIISVPRVNCDGRYWVELSLSAYAISDGTIHIEGRAKLEYSDSGRENEVSDENIFNLIVPKGGVPATKRIGLSNFGEGCRTTIRIVLANSLVED
jgi:hypothetical protein